MQGVYSDDAVVAQLTDDLTADGVRLFSFFRMDADDTEHVRAQLEQMALPHSARVLDVGCGVGEFARIAATLRDDLDFTLLNVSPAQLARCPDGFEKITADFHNIPAQDGAFDAVLLDYAIGHGALLLLMQELARVVKHGGIVFMHDLFARNNEDATEFSAVLGYAAYSVAEVMDAADAAGLVMLGAWEDRCSAPLPDDVTRPVRHTLEAMQPMALRFVKAGRPLAAALNHHERIALQYSGGKDSTAVLYLLRPWWDRLTVYWTNTGDPVPETLEVIDEVRAEVAHFVEITGDVKAWRAANGTPSDIVTFRGHAIGNFLGFGDLRLSNRFDCCWANLMLPMVQRMQADGVTLIVRGTKDADMPAQPVNSGDIHDGFEILYPVQDWSDEEVFDFLAQEGAPVADYYAFGAPTAPECLGCTAWWDDRKAAFMAARHPEQYAQYRDTLKRIKSGALASLACLEREIGEGEDHGGA
ncbi:MAG: methyltransferase domain-containing protein [Mizugakiibacter sp.]|uniref:methyltransferase domain-containing protein n=1 Tax=Mizugakiibacter sp. TaxID=1972610 RepID=UPI00320C6B7C